MSVRTRKPAKLSLKAEFQAEYDRRIQERREREEAERRQHELDLANATELCELLSADKAFLAEHGLAVDQRRYSVSIDLANYRIAAYFEAGRPVST